MTRPNLIILGAPKCGTSSLFNWLDAHPDIAGSRRKETFILMDRDNPLLGQPNIHDQGEEAFAGDYGEDADRAAFRLEATTHTLFQETALKAVADWQDLKVVVVLREPAARVFSSFAYTQNNLGRIGADTTFADYLTRVDQGLPLYPEVVRDPASAFVLERDPDYSRYARWLSPWVEMLGRDRVCVVLFEEMSKEPEATVQRIFAWLGLSPLELPQDMGARNRTETVRSPRIQRFARRLNAAVTLPDGLKDRLKSAYMLLQKKPPSDRSEADAAALAKLRGTYVDDNAELARMTGLDFDVWTRGNSS